MTGSNHVCRVESVTVSGGGVYLNAQHLSRPSVVYRKIPLLANFSGLIAVPKVGQRVVVTETTNGFEYVEGVLTGPEDEVPTLEEREFLLQFDPTTKITVTKDGSGGYDLSIESSGDVDVKAGGDIRVGENGEKVAKQNHTHPISWTDSGGSGDSGTPNEDGTNTTIK